MSTTDKEADNGLRLEQARRWWDQRLESLSHGIPLTAERLAIVLADYADFAASKESER